MPLREQEQLRQLPPIVDRTALKLKAGVPQNIGASWPAGAAKHSEVVATFAMPKAAAVFGIGIAAVGGKPAKEAFVEFKPRTGPSPDGPWWEVRVGVGPPAHDGEAGGGGVEAAEQSLHVSALCAEDNPGASDPVAPLRVVAVMQQLEELDDAEKQSIAAKVESAPGCRGARGR